MNRAQWLWMQASLAVIANAVAALRRDAPSATDEAPLPAAPSLSGDA